MALSGVPAHAQTAWTGANSTDWFAPGNWDAGVPTNAANAEIDTVANNLAAIEGSPAQALNTFVGLSSNGVLTIQNGGSLTNDRGLIGQNLNSSGAVAVVGNGASWTSSIYLIVGNLGQGSLTVANGGTVASADAYLGAGPDAFGAAFVTGAGSVWTTSGSFIIGNSGIGTINIENGGKVSSSDAEIGYFGGSSGSVYVIGNGSAWDSSGILTIGQDGEATIDIQNGGRISSQHSLFAENAGSVAKAFIGGEGSQWITAGNFLVGEAGEADVVVHGGGTAAATASVLGSDDGSSGLIVVTDPGSTFSVSNNIHIGGSGTGGLVAVSGGVMQSGGGILANAQNAIGNALVRGKDSAWLINGSLVVGNSGTAGLFVEDGGRLTSIKAEIGRFSASDGSAYVTGEGSAWINAGDLHIGGEGAGSLSIADGGVVEAGGTTFLATVAGSTGSLNIGAAAGLAPLVPGQLTAEKVAFGEGNGTLVLNHSGAGYLFTPRLEGAGTITALSGTTSLISDSSGFTGYASIHHGATLVVNGKLGGMLEVSSGGRLAGSGMVGSTHVAGGGTIAPGNSIGTLNVAGNITFAADSVYEVEVNPAGTDADLIHATGTATLDGGAVTHVGLGGTYQPFRTYEIVAADGGVAGTFAGVTSDFAFLDPLLSYDPNSVFLTLVRNEVSFCSVGLTPNQCATGDGVQSLGPGSQLNDALVVLDDETARTAFDQLSGEIHASIRGAMLEDSRFVRDAATGRVRAAFDDVEARPLAVLSYGEDRPASVVADRDRLAVWAHAFGAWGEFDGDGNAAALERNTGGLLLGADALALDTWRIGVLAGYSRSSYDVDDRASSGESDNLHLGVYGGSRWGNVGVRLGAAYSWLDVDVNRSVAFAGFADRLEAGYDAGTGQIFVETGYRIETAPASFEPFAALAYVNVDTDSLTESGGAAALASARSNTDATFTTLGVRASTEFTLDGMKITALGMLGWRHAIGDVAPWAAFAFDGGDTFAIAGAPIARDSAIVEAGFDFQVTPFAKLGLAYNGQFGSGLSDHGARANLAVRF
jgi:outer membrane autotransporter protein